MTTITLMTIDQILSVTDQPKITSGDRDTDKIRVEFDEVWQKYTKSAVFYTDYDNRVYEILMDSDECIIPHEVLAKAGTLYIGIRGVNLDTNAVKTSTLVKYKIENGAPSGSEAALPPTATDYQQIISIMKDTNAIAHSVRDDFDAGAIPALLDHNSKAGFRFWSGTKEEYEEQKSELPPNVLCVITDDTTKDELASAVRGDFFCNTSQSVYFSNNDIDRYSYFVVVGNTYGETYTLNIVHKTDEGFRAYQYGTPDEDVNYRKIHIYFDKSTGKWKVDATIHYKDGTNDLWTHIKVYGFTYMFGGGN